jgi:hypothetical protein
MSLNPAQDEIEARRKREAIELCGKNRGPHDYIPIEWMQLSESNIKRVTRLMCRVCFHNIAMSVLLNNYPEITT